jgi:uncharacterized protein with ParB-like and HNH nuclease domain
MEAFRTNTNTIRQLLKNEIDEHDRGKNYFIPPYQRKYDWDKDEVEKLIDDIYEQANKKSDKGYKPYFIGGIVLSQQSMLGGERSKKSLEIIDGQQRLTTIVLILASIVQLLKFQDRDFETQQDIATHLINDISKILNIKTLNLDTMKIEEKYILERSDTLSKDFEQTISFLIEKKLGYTELASSVSNSDDSKKLINLVHIIKEKIDLYEANELVDFTVQLLNNTWLVVTKTISIETGFFIFEKLNDSGIALEPQDLLKNYLFRTSDEKEYAELTIIWEHFLDTVKNINSSKAKILPRDFLEQYLTIIGKNLKDDKKSSNSGNGYIFSQFKAINNSDFKRSLLLLEDLIKIATEYGHLKRDNRIAQYLNLMNFKLGYLILLSFYKRFDSAYMEYRNDILRITVKLGFVYLIIGQSKDLSIVIPTICSEIITKGNTIDEVLLIINGYINGLVSKKKSILDEVISSTNLWRKKPLTNLLFSILEFHISQKKLPLTFSLAQKMPQNYSSEFLYDEIDEDNCDKYANYIGNILVDESSISFAGLDKNILLNDLSKQIEVQDNKLTVSSLAIDTISLGWGKNSIVDRSQKLAELTKFIFINDNFNKDFFNELK